MPTRNPTNLSNKYCIFFSFIPSIDFGGQRQRYENKLATFRRQAEERQDLQLRKEDAGEAGQEDQEDVSTESSEVNDASPHFEIFKVILGMFTLWKIVHGRCGSVSYSSSYSLTRFM
jgi:hypothetical protein